MSQAAIFRRASLDRLSSPEQLDRLLQVTRPAAWAALTACALLCAAGIAWGVGGRVPVKVRGQGILLKSGGILEVVAGTAGRIVDVAVDVGDQVREGQIVARIAQPELAEQVVKARLVLEHARAAHEQAVAFGSREDRLEMAYIEGRRRNLQESIAAAEKSAAWFAQKIATQRELVNEGRLTRQSLIGTVQQQEEALERGRRLRSDIAELEVKRLEGRAGRERARQESATRVAEAQAELERLEREGSAATEVVSPYTGRIIELMVEQGTVVDRAAPLMSLDLTGRTVKELEAVVYVPAQDGKRVRPGMTVHLAPATVKPAEYGHLLGRVTYVSDFPTTSRGMLRVLKNKELAAALAGDDPPHEMHVDLVPDPGTPSLYKWSSSSGPPMRIQSGTMCAAEVTVEERRPIEMVVPFLRRMAPR